jgi:phosphomannomutase
VTTLPPVFGTAGVRGVFNSTQTPEQVYRLAATSAFVFGRGFYGIGWDGRKSSALLARVVAAGVVAAGGRALSFGLVPTPVTAFGAREEGCRLGFSVTASHNPPEYSGVKFFGGNGMELARDQELRIERAMAAGAGAAGGFGTAASREVVLDSYLERLASRFERLQKEGLRVVVDCANGPGALVTPRALIALGHRVVPLNAQVSWRFPARLPEPTAHNLIDTAAVVPALGADLGFAHDGDADRLVMVSSSGRVLPDSTVSILALRATLRGRGRGATVVLSENTSSAVEEEAVGMGCRVVRSRVGKSFAEVEKEGAAFATEPSKVVDPRWGLWEDGMYAAVLISDAIAREPELLRLVDSEPRWRFRQVNVPVSVDLSTASGRLEMEFSRFRTSEVRRLDGLKIVFKDRSWIMFRSSGTEPKTRIYCESLDQARLEELLAVAKKVLEEVAGPGRGPR